MEIMVFFSSRAPKSLSIGLFTFEIIKYNLNLCVKWKRFDGKDGEQMNERTITDKILADDIR